MKILFSPAETKKSGGNSQAKIAMQSFLFPELFAQRMEVLEKYNSYIANASDAQLQKIFGIKDLEKCKAFQKDLFCQPLMKVIERYDGVAFDYLAYGDLSPEAQAYIDREVILFSNLFGPLGAGDTGIPEYKLKQGEKIGGFAPEAFYKQCFSAHLDALLNEPFLDLRAGFYLKFYKASSPYTTVKFLKEGKVVSHWAKAYRGILLKHIASESLQDTSGLEDLQVEGLQVHTVTRKGLETEIIYNIV